MKFRCKEIEMEKETKEGGFRRDKMREALNDIVGIAKIALSVNCVGNSNNSELWDIIDKAKAALAEPERNCDLFESPKNETDEQKIWDDYHKWCNNPRNRDIDNFPIHSVVGWLLAPATGRRG